MEAFVGLIIFGGIIALIYRVIDNKYRMEKLEDELNRRDQEKK